MPKIHIDEIFSKDAGSPMIINFQNGYTSDNFHSDKSGLFTNEKTGCKSVSVEVNDMIYAGDEEKEVLGKTLLLAKNRKTGKVRLIEVGSALLKPVLNIENESSALLETSHLELSRKFGSKKQKQQMEQREKLKVNVDTVTEQMLNVTETISEDKLDLSSYNKTDSDDFYIPPIDKTADKPENVYDINKILTENQFEKVFSELEEKDYMSDFLPFINSLTADKKLSRRHTVLAVYTNCLLKFSLTMAKEIQKKSYVACPHSITLNNIILDNFTTFHNGNRKRPTPYKDKALCHAIVFALLINNLKFNLESFCGDTKLTPVTATLKVKVTGATIVTNGSKKVAQLKLPLSTKGGFRRKSAKF